MTTPTPVIEKLTDRKYLNLYFVKRDAPPGPPLWIFASRKDAASAGTVAADAVAIIATVATPEGPRLLVTREFRSPINRYEISVPSGLVDPGEAVAVAAARELYEETGLTLTQTHHVSPPVSSSAGMTDESVCLLYGEASGTLSREFQTEHEDIEARLLSIEDIRRLLRNPGADVISSRLYPMFVGFVAAGTFAFPKLG